MPPAPRTPAAPAAPVLRLRARSVALVVAVLGLSLLALRLLAAAERVVGWMLVAAAVAGLLHPLVERMARRIPRGLAVLLIGLATVGVVGGVTYGVVEDLRSATERLQQAAPEAAREISRSERFGDLARSIDLTQRTGDFVADVPDRLRGGSPGDALRTAATRGVAFLTTGVLTLFLLLHGPTILRAALEQIPDEAQRERAARVGVAAYRRAFGYARGSLLLALLVGVLGYVLARSLGVPGAAALALWVALWDVVPIIGATVGALPIVVLAAVDSPTKGWVAAGLIVGYQVLEDALLQRRLEARSMQLGPFLTLAAGLAGFELRGATGALLAVLAVALVAAALDEAAPDAPTGPQTSPR